MQHRPSDISTYFSHENHSFPLIVESCGWVRNLKDTQNNNTPTGSIDVRILDGVAVVHYLETKGIVTFDEYADQVLMLCATRSYISNSIKENEKGVQRKVTGNNKLPSNWADFLHESANKQDLSFLTRLPLCEADTKDADPPTGCRPSEWLY